MSPLFMDTECEPTTPGSLSADDSNSHTAGSEREGEGPQLPKKTGTKRREKNRDAARKSRRKQTERADELHEELQSLERSNSALQKEIAALKKDFHLYTTALESHEPYCPLTASAPSSSSSSRSSSSTGLSVSSTADCQIASSPMKCPRKTSSSTLLAASSISTSLNSSLGLQTHDCVENINLSPSAPTTLASSSATPTDLFITSSSSPVTVPYSLSFSTLPAPHSLFSEGPLITSSPTNSKPVSSSPVPNPIPFSALPPSVQDALHETSSLSVDSCFFTHNLDSLDAFVMKQTSFITSSSNVMPPYSNVETENVVPAQGHCMNTGFFSGNPNNSSSLLPSTLRDPTPQSLAVSPQTFPAPVFGLKPSCNQQIKPNTSSLLSLLTVPSPLNIPQTTSNTFDELISQSPPPLPTLGDPSRDLSLSELLDFNDWILSGRKNL
ncbi:Basic leucine zipper transcriptional factor ATF-like 3 [Channa argus]|uniref:Basic leucine zipper transcriptional factor ATF-like 3 n=1 Tax=Channa argus TaxID=215402 RepID=A0A6G1Q4U4_CHAAH|nr:Basic leucine zipper transcriptional factor ATF-like 3 [Channa argus]